MSGFFDSVLDSKKLPVFVGTPKDTAKWIRDHPLMRYENFEVRYGHTMRIVSVDQYLNAVEDVEKFDAAEEHAKTEAVLELVRDAISVGDPNFHASVITDKIIKLLS